MARHKFKIGQTVTFTPPRMTYAASSREYTIVRLLPSEGNDCQYRIKGVAEPFERIARESELTARS
ncbi:MAG: hypothetical protein F9K29_14555 [Hyphomicrobiaceae bacterium]|nr:MAG: hypothetical protein F9K29_14555 [Hyphomicrobiaceae bacterium]